MGAAWDKLYNNSFFIGLMFLTSLLYFFFSGLFYGLDFTDSFFHINQAAQPVDGIYLYPIVLSSLLLNGIIDVFGNHLVVLRLINSFLLLLAVVLPFFIIKHEFPHKKILFVLALILIVLNTGEGNILGYDTFSILFISVVFSVAVRYLQQPRYLLIVLLGLLVAISVLLRLPNVLLLPLLVVFLFRVERNRSLAVLPALKTPFLFGLFTVLFALAGYGLYYRDIDLFLGSGIDASGHGIGPLLQMYLRDASRLLLIVVFILGNLFVFRKVKAMTNSTVAYALVFVAVSVFLWIFVMFSVVSWNYRLYVTGLVLAFIVVNLVKSPLRLLGNGSLIFLLFAAVLFVMPFGSNTGLLKAFSLVVLFPVIYFLSSFALKRFWLFLLLVLVPFSIVEKLYITYEDAPYFKLDHTVSHDALYPIKTTATRANYLQQVDTTVKQLRENNVQVYFYGDKSHIFHYLYPGTHLNIRAFYQPLDNISLLPQIQKEIPANSPSAIFITPAYPENPQPKTPNPLHDELVKMGFEMVDENGVVYYLKL